jgi:hypothetical protein
VGGSIQNILCVCMCVYIYIYIGGGIVHESLC